MKTFFIIIAMAIILIYVFIYLYDYISIKQEQKRILSNKLTFNDRINILRMVSFKLLLIKSQCFSKILFDTLYDILGSKNYKKLWTITLNINPNYFNDNFNLYTLYKIKDRKLLIKEIEIFINKISDECI